ncbi:MAG: class I SAM-dependent methyltransferase [Planctomycetes bacterium]|nr:class I SAM-dependent methyltransferase [Planctomycetota bacterium]
MNDKQIGTFFDSLSEDYTAVIERCFPRYREMLWALLDYLPTDKPIGSILELGCGTGNLSVLLANAFPAASIRVVDVSRESLELSRARLDDSRFAFEERDFRDLSCDSNSLDLVVSSIAVHHLTSLEKRRLFAQIYDWLKPAGTFCFADQFRGATEDLYQRHIHHWHEQSMAAGSSSDEWEMWMDHQLEHDFHDSLTDQVDWLRDAGFSIIDCPWRYLLWAIVQARKS